MLNAELQMLNVILIFFITGFFDLVDEGLGAGFFDFAVDHDVDAVG